MADSVREGAAKRKEKAAKIIADDESIQIGLGEGLAHKRIEKIKGKEKKQKAKLFNLKDLLSNDCDSIVDKKQKG